ncbi:hypothetical protein IK110_03345 [Candidatus Saccharibacteria bacterium]|nr:hypothetical protein [Candidatus Saccharibacteria bacterium]
MGEEHQEENHSHISTNYVNLKIVISAVFSVLLGAVAILALINFGMNVQKKFDNENREQQAQNRIESIIAVDYEVDTFRYSGLLGDETLKDKLGLSGEEKAFIVDSKDKLSQVTEAITGIDGSEPFYQVSDTFFNSSSVIVVPVEAADLNGAKVKSVTRDENYNIQIDIEKDEELDTKTGKFNGRAIFVKLRNIQPADVTVNID